LPTCRVIDSSLLIEADRRGILGELEAYLHANIPSVASPRVLEETVTEAKAIGYADSAARIEKLFNTGTLRLEQPDYSDRQITRIVDNIRKYIARKSGKQVHLIERADLQMVAPAVAHAKGGDQVELIFRDKALKVCLEAALTREKVFRVAVVGFALLIDELISRARMRR
jgi:hypothetical protein